MLLNKGPSVWLVGARPPPIKSYYEFDKLKIQQTQTEKNDELNSLGSKLGELGDDLPWWQMVYQKCVEIMKLSHIRPVCLLSMNV